MIYNKVCEICNCTYLSKRKNQKVCSEKCRIIKRNKYLNKRYIKKEQKKRICLVCKNIFLPKSCREKVCSLECRLKHRKIYRLNNLDKFKKRHKNYMLNPVHKQHSYEYNKKWFIKNKDKVLQKMYIYHKNKMKTNINYKIHNQIRNRIGSALRLNREYKKQNKTLELLGCNIIEFKKHIEKQFQPGMTWENHGFYGWHIDHIKPVSSFNLIKNEEQKKCFHYTNQQPLWAHDNLSKNKREIISDKIT